MSGLGENRAVQNWVQQQYNVMNQNGTFFGRKSFRKHLLSQLPEEFANETLKVRQCANTIARTGTLGGETVNPAPFTPKALYTDTTPAPSPSPDPNIADGRPTAVVVSITALPSPAPPPIAKTIPLNSQVRGTSPTNERFVPGSNRPDRKLALVGQSIAAPSSPVQLLRGLLPRGPQTNGFTETFKNDVNGDPRHGGNKYQNGDQLDDTPTLDDQMCLLDTDGLGDEWDDRGLSNSDVSNATIFSPSLLKDSSWREMLPQYALLGNAFPANEIQLTSKADRRLFLNTNIPWSTFICGVQGSGKSHTMSCLIENSLISSKVLGVLKSPLSALVFYCGHYTSRLNFRPCEAAFLAYPSLQFQHHGSVRSVNVLVSPSNLHNLEHAYAQIPGVKVQPLKLQPKHLNIGSMLALMSVNQSQSAPLYMSQVVKILREMAEVATGDFDFADFKKRLRDTDFTPMQRTPLNQRIEVLESFLDLDNKSSCFDFGSGSITVVDLSCPFVDENTACVLFNICLGVYLEGSSSEIGKIVAVDEAHKYLTDTPASKVFTDSLLAAIRQQRHYGLRVIIATQEPTISPRLIDLCSMVMVHRFTSPEWFSVLRKHIPTPDKEDEAMKIFDRIIDLRVGESLVFAPLGVMSYVDATTPTKLGSSLLRVKVRKRLTKDGGKSIVCV